MSQLDLFAGKILTADQQEKVAGFISRQERMAIKNETRFNKMLIDLEFGGLVRGEDFEFNYRIETITEDVVLGYAYDDSQFTAENITYRSGRGGIKFLFKRYHKDDNKVVDTATSYFDYEDGKFAVDSIIGSYRKVKPSTLKKKIEEKNKAAQREFDQVNQENLTFAELIDELREKYPLAEITRIEDYVKSGGRFFIKKRIKATFENGSWIKFNVSIYSKSLSIVDKFNAEIDRMDVDELMNEFSNQNK